MSEQYPHLVFEGFSSKLGERVMGILRALFPVPKEEGRRVMTFANDQDFISFRWVAGPPNLHSDIRKVCIRGLMGGIEDITYSRRPRIRTSSWRKSDPASRRNVSHPSQLVF